MTVNFLIMEEDCAPRYARKYHRNIRDNHYYAYYSGLSLGLACRYPLHPHSNYGKVFRTFDYVYKKFLRLGALVGFQTPQAWPHGTSQLCFYVTN